MSSNHKTLQLIKPRISPGGPNRKQATALIGQILMELGDLSPADLAKATAIRTREDVRFGEILVANKMVSEGALYRALSHQHSCDVADLTMPHPDTRLIETLSPAFCLRHGIIPWKRVGAITLIATCRPEEFINFGNRLPADFGKVLMVLAPENAIHDALLRSSQTTLAKRAEARVATSQSCRNWNAKVMRRGLFLLISTLGIWTIVAPKQVLFMVTTWAVLALVFNTALKAAAAWVALGSARNTPVAFASARQQKTQMLLPKISILVPLFREQEITERLVRRLGRLIYPRELLDICLIVEQDDAVTTNALSKANLPHWMRRIIVPRAELRTKPRALNYALDFCKGTIVGVYDAEDAPEKDQLHKIARRFHDADPETACLQGVLDYYNTRTNWLSRCFTIEYAMWFRAVLPGLEKLGFVIPLGGTTVFFRREALEKIGGWDAHNVTEDADLGVRLARHGYRTELVATLTEEEANCRVLPWIRQRSRWLKGYAITWAVHMRQPRQLWADLGAWRFFGVQLVFVGALSQFLLAPFLWTFWALAFGIPHPLSQAMTPTAIYMLTCLFILSEIVTIVVGVVSLAPNRHQRLWPWVPTLHFYFPLAAIAAYKGVWELCTKPFYWDKTAHGLNYAKPRTLFAKGYFWRLFQPERRSASNLRRVS